MKHHIDAAVKAQPGNLKALGRAARPVGKLAGSWTVKAYVLLEQAVEKHGKKNPLLVFCVAAFALLVLVSLLVRLVYNFWDEALYAAITALAVILAGSFTFSFAKSLLKKK